MCDKISALTKDDANKALDNINMWINNCDTKTSIILGFYATIITICLSTDFLNVQTAILSYFFIDINFLKILYITIHFIAITIFIVGIIKLLKVIVPRIILNTKSNKEYNSILFYGSIAKNMPTFEKYCEEIKRVTSDIQILNDLLFQIHSAAIICNKKFHYQKTGLILTTVSLMIYFITTIIGVLII